MKLIYLTQWRYTVIFVIFAAFLIFWVGCSRFDFLKVLKSLRLCDGQPPSLTLLLHWLQNSCGRHRMWTYLLSKSKRLWSSGRRASLFDKKYLSSQRRNSWRYIKSIQKSFNWKYRITNVYIIFKINFEKESSLLISKTFIVIMCTKIFLKILHSAMSSEAKKLKKSRSTNHLDRSVRPKKSWSTYHLEGSERLKSTFYKVPLAPHLTRS